MKLLTLAPVAIFAFVGLYTPAAWADILPPDTGDTASEEEEEGGSDTGEDKDGGCSTAAATSSVAAMGLGIAMIFGLRRKDD